MLPYYHDNTKYLYGCRGIIVPSRSSSHGWNGWEFSGEGWRRNDLVRFGKYNDPCDFRPVAADDHYNLFPVPQDQINANPNLDQNPGYE
jgi:hypothetical protein